MDNNLDIITVFNPDVEPFYIRYNNQSYGIIEPNKARRMPRFMAKLVVKHLVDQCINTAKGNTASQPLRDEWSARIVLEEEIYAPVMQETEDEKLRKNMDELNRSADLDRVLANKKNETTQSDANFTPQTPAPAAPQPYHENQVNQMQQAPAQPAQPAPTPPASMTPSTPPPAAAIPSEPQVDVAANTVRVAESIGVTPPAGESKVLPEIDMTQPDPAPAAPTEAKAPPTREELYTYARTTLAMNLDDPKTLEALDAQNETQLMETLGYDPTAA